MENQIFSEEKEKEEEEELLENFQKKISIIPELEDIVIGVSVQFWKEDDDNIKFNCDVTEQQIVSNKIKQVIKENRAVGINIDMSHATDRKILKSGIVVVYISLYLDQSRTITCGIIAESYDFSNLELPRKNMDQTMSEFLDSNNKRVYWIIHDNDNNNDNNKIAKTGNESVRNKLLTVADANQKKSQKENEETYQMMKKQMENQIQEKNKLNDDGDLIKWKNTISNNWISLEITSKPWVLQKSNDTCCIKNIYIEIHLEDKRFYNYLKTCIDLEYSKNPAV